MKEIWKDIPDYEGIYQVSNLGRIKSLERKIWNVKNNSYSKLKCKILKQSLTGKGYLAVNLHKNGIKKTKTIHVLVAICFLGHKQSGMKGFIVDHKDNIKTNNKLSNLKLITNRKNLSKNKKGTSKYTGVSWNKNKNKWIAQIYMNGKNKNLGYFDNEYSAHIKYQQELMNM